MEIFRKIGKDIGSFDRVEDALTEVGLNWNVRKIPVFADIDGNTEQVKDAFLNVREDTGQQMGVVGNRYNVIQNAETFSVINPLLEDGKIKIENAGSFDEGRRVWLQAKIGDEINPVSGDPIEKYAIFYNSFDGSSGTGVAITPLRVWCQNMLRAAINKGDRKIALRHTLNYKKRLDEAYYIFNNVNNYFDLFEEEMKFLSNNTIDIKTANIFVDKFIPLPDTKQQGTIDSAKRNRETLRQLIESGKGMDIPGVRGTAYGLYNAAVEYTQFHKRIKGKDFTQEQKLSKRAESMIFDSTLDKSARRAETLAMRAAKGTLVTV